MTRHRPILPMIHRFDEFTLDDRRFQLRRRDEIVLVEPRVFDLIAFLVRHRSRVVPKDELLDQLWSGRTVAESSLFACVSAARKALGERTTKARFIKTVHGRG